MSFTPRYLPECMPTYSFCICICMHIPNESSGLNEMLGNLKKIWESKRNQMEGKCSFVHGILDVMNITFSKSATFKLLQSSSQSKNFRILSSLLKFYFTCLSQEINFDCFFFRNFANCTQVRDFFISKLVHELARENHIEIALCHLFRISLGVMILHKNLENVII